MRAKPSRGLVVFRLLLGGPDDGCGEVPLSPRDWCVGEVVERVGTGKTSDGEIATSLLVTLGRRRESGRGTATIRREIRGRDATSP